MVDRSIKDVHEQLTLNEELKGLKSVSSLAAQNMEVRAPLTSNFENGPSLIDTLRVVSYFARTTALAKKSKNYERRLSRGVWRILSGSIFLLFSYLVFASLCGGDVARLTSAASL